MSPAIGLPADHSNPSLGLRERVSHIADTHVNDGQVGGGLEVSKTAEQLVAQIHTAPPVWVHALSPVNAAS